MIERQKVFAYITWREKLLVFEEGDFPQLGVQVPKGTVERGERPEEAVLREAREETGLVDLKFGSFLGASRRDMSDLGVDEIHHEHFYHLVCFSEPLAGWTHYEMNPSDGTPGPIAFNLYWVDLPAGVPELCPGHAQFLGELLYRIEGMRPYRPGERWPGFTRLPQETVRRATGDHMLALRVRGAQDSLSVRLI